jgi:Ni,Fe-hydrogenase III large subunit
MPSCSCSSFTTGSSIAARYPTAFRNPTFAGELLYCIKAGGRKFLDRLRIRTPTFANLPALLPGVWLSDVPVIVLSIHPCVSCTER